MPVFPSRDRRPAAHPRLVAILSGLVLTTLPAQVPTVGPEFLPTTAAAIPAPARAADLDGDGQNDLFYLQNGTAVVQRGLGGGQFSTPIVTAGVPASPFNDFGDFNGDGLPDLVVSPAGSLSIWMNAGGGAFTFSQTIAIAGGLNRYVVALNVNPAVDADVDLAVVDTSGGFARVRLYSNTGSGTFSTAATLVGSVSGFNGSQVHAADMDGDGDMDLVTVYQGGFMVNDRLYVLFNNGSGSFSATYFIQLTQSGYQNRLTLVDVAGNPRPDVLTYNSISVVVYVNSGTGTISNTVASVTTLSSISGVDAADLDGDGDADAAVVDNSSPYDAELMLGDGTGSFVGTALPLTGTNPNPCCPDLADLDGDGRSDLLFTVQGGTPMLGIVWIGHVAPDFRKVMISEVSWDNPDYLEVTNYGLGAANLAGWTVLWKDGSVITSSPLAITLQAGESAVIGEPGTIAALNLPPPIQVVQALSTIGSTSGDLAVALRDGTGAVVDEVRIASTAGAYAEGSLGGAFRGLARRDGGGFVTMERLWGLDSDGGGDWTAETVKSPGFENRGSGPRGTDPVGLVKVLINETDDNPDLIELYNPNPFPVGLGGAMLWCSAGQNGNHTIVTIPPGPATIAADGYLVIGEGVNPPAEIPAGVPYVDVAQNIPWITEEYDCVLYDRYGRVMDAMRTTGDDDVVTHNHPRAPTHWADFRGAAGRQDGGGDDSVGRRNAVDTDQGSDFAPFVIRTMGSANPPAYAASLDDGFASDLDVRLSDHALGGGLDVIVNAGPAHAGDKFSYFASLAHYFGQGPVAGLGLDAPEIWLVFSAIPPFGDFLDARGSHLIRIPPGALPPGFDMDIIAILQSPAGTFLTRTLVLEYDSF